MHVHVSETRSEHENCIQKYGKTPVALLDQYGVWVNGGTAAHCVWVTDEGHGADGPAGLPPSTTRVQLGSWPPARPGRQVAGAGGNVALGTDGVASNNSHDLFEEIKLAAILHKGDRPGPHGSDRAAGPGDGHRQRGAGPGTEHRGHRSGQNGGPDPGGSSRAQSVPLP